MLKQNINIITILVFLLSGTVLSQEKDTLKTDVISVVKAYKPKISDAFKVKEKPVLDEGVVQAKKEIKYNIFSFPVASTFKPAKSKAAKIEKKKREKLYDNYASLGVGNYLNVLGDLYINKAFGKTQSVGVYLGHHSSQGGIEDLLVDDMFSNSQAKLDYSVRSKSFMLNLGGGYQYQAYNWYGIPQPEFDKEKLESFNTNVKHSYTNAFATADIDLDNSLFKSANLLFRRFGDSYASGENHALVKLTGKVPINGVDFLTTLYGDFVGGSFKRQYAYNLAQEYQNMQFGISPSFKILNDNLSVTLGATIVYSNSTGEKKNSIFFYPNVEASYRLAGDMVIAHGSAKGGLIQNTYHEFTSENPYVSPNIFIQPTNKLFDAFGGLKGLIGNVVGYDFGVGLKSENRKALFQNNLISYGVDSDQGYHLGNSFGLVYDNITTMTFAAKLNVDINRNFTMGVKGEYFNYSTKKEEHAWNLPDMRADLFLDYQISKQWFAGANVFYVGNRKAITGIQYVPELATEPISKIVTEKTLSSFIDANINLGYHVDERLSAYVKVNNLLNNKYERWVHTPVQGLQFLFGATYKFNF